MILKKRILNLHYGIVFIKLQKKKYILVLNSAFCRQEGVCTDSHLIEFVIKNFSIGHKSIIMLKFIWSVKLYVIFYIAETILVVY